MPDPYKFSVAGSCGKKLPLISGPGCGPYDGLIAIVDATPETAGAGIIVIEINGSRAEIRGGPRKRWVWVTPKGFGPPSLSSGQDAEESSLDSHRRPRKETTPGFWDRWGDSVLSCGSAAATGVVIYLSGGVAGFWVGAFAANSALLCGTSVGKGIYQDEWQEFKRQGGNAYTAWLTVETFLNLADLANGASGAIKLLRNLDKAGDLARLSKAVKGKNITRANLVKLIQEIDPSFRPNLSAKSSQYISKGKLITIGQKAIAKEKYVGLVRYKAGMISDGIGNALTLGASPGVFQSSRETVDVWIVDYQQ